MDKDAFYFPHFSGARFDRKILRVRKELGLEGYAIYFMVLEVLRDQVEMKYPVSDIDLLADEFGTSEQKVRTVICNYALFQIENEQFFFSPKLYLYLEPYFKMKKQRQLAGKQSAAKRMLNDRSTTVQQSKVKESKGNSSKEKKSKLKESKPKESKELVFPFSSLEFKNVWDVLIAESKWKRKSFAALQTSLEFLSKHSEPEAIQIMKNSIAGGWQGLFELKNGHNGTAKNQYTNPDGSTNFQAAYESGKEFLRKQGLG